MSISHFSTSGAKSARRLPAEMQRKLAMFQRRKGRTCPHSHRISRGTHEAHAGPRSLRKRKTAPAEEALAYAARQNRFHGLLNEFANPTMGVHFSRFLWSWAKKAVPGVRKSDLREFTAALPPSRPGRLPRHRCGSAGAPIADSFARTDG